MKREYPDRPIVGVGGVVVHRQRALLIRRGCEPHKGQWSIPGGMLELGEELADGVRRELKEETGLDVEPLQIVAAFDRITREGKRVKYHYVIVDYVCRLKRGRLRPASDVVDARWVRRGDLPKYHLTEMATKVILKAFDIMERRRRGTALGTSLPECPVASQIIPTKAGIQQSGFLGEFQRVGGAHRREAEGGPVFPDAAF